MTRMTFILDSTSIHTGLCRQQIISNWLDRELSFVWDQSYDFVRLQTSCCEIDQALEDICKQMIQLVELQLNIDHKPFRTEFS